MMQGLETEMDRGEGSWHGGIGTMLRNPNTIEQGLIKAGLNWRVKERPIAWYEEARSGINHISRQKALVRDTDGQVLGVVGSNYEILQNSEAFSFFDSFLEGGECSLEAAGSLKEGRVIFVIARIHAAEGDVLANDRVNAYLLLYNSHDGSLAVGIQFTSIRVACQNTLGLARREVRAGLAHGIKLPHRRGLAQSLDLVRRRVEVARQDFSKTIESFQHLAAKELKRGALEQYVRDVLGYHDLKTVPRAFREIEECYYMAPGADLPGVRGTYWGAYNAVTNWLDYGRGRTSDASLYSSWFGSSAKMRDKAYCTALLH